MANAKADQFMAKTLPSRRTYHDWDQWLKLQDEKGTARGLQVC